jgi:hypothetical protein
MLALQNMFDPSVFAKVDAEPGGDGCEASALRGTLTHRFTRHVSALFDTGPADPADVAGPGHSQAPALLSVSGPTQVSGINALNTSFGISTMSFDAGPGVYTFSADAFVAPECVDATLTHEAVGKSPYVVVAAADADFPACTTKGARIVARARDHHPICR